MKSVCTVWIGAALLGVLVAARGAGAAGEQADAPVISLPAAPGAPAPVSTNPPETVLVRVNDAEITQADVNAELADLTRMMESRGGSAPAQLAVMLPAITPQILDSLVVRRLLDGEFARKQITASEAELDGEIERIRATLPKGKTLEALLKTNGVSEQMFRDDLAEQVKLGKLLEVQAPSDADLKTDYDEHPDRYARPESVRARHILIQLQPTDGPAEKAAKKARAESLHKQIVESKGADFEALAREHSDCPSKANGGDLGEFRKGQMVPPFEEAAFGLKVNEISPVVETDFGYHIIQTLEHTDARTVPFEEVKGQIAAQHRARQLQQKATPYLKSLRESAKIEYLNGAKPLTPMAFPMAPDGDGEPPAKAAPAETPAPSAEAPTPAAAPADTPAPAPEAPSPKAP